MPSATDFKKAFGLIKGEEIELCCSVEDSNVGHVVKQENERYEFPTRVTLSLGTGVSQRQALAAFRAHVRESRIVYSAYGSPYECTYGAAKLPKWEGEGDAEGRVTITCLGKAVRRRDIPTLKEVKEKEREEKGQAQEVSAGDEELLSGMRVIKSRFGSSKCSLCGQTIDPGVRIARPEGEQRRGGWAHVGCVVAEEKKKQRAHGLAAPATPKKAPAKRRAGGAASKGKASIKSREPAGKSQGTAKRRVQQTVAAQRGKRARR